MNKIANRQSLLLTNIHCIILYGTYVFHLVHRKLESKWDVHQYIGAIDGLHLSVSPPTLIHTYYYNHKCHHIIIWGPYHAKSHYQLLIAKEVDIRTYMHTLTDFPDKELSRTRYVAGMHLLLKCLHGRSFISLPTWSIHHYPLGTCRLLSLFPGKSIYYILL